MTETKVKIGDTVLVYKHDGLYEAKIIKIKSWKEDKYKYDKVPRRFFGTKRVLVKSGKKKRTRYLVQFTDNMYCWVDSVEKL